jgi:hypothetical protein
MSHPVHPLLLAREDGEQKEQVGIHIRSSVRDALGGGDGATHVPVVGHPVEADGERTDVLRDLLAGFRIQGRFLGFW